MLIGPFPSGALGLMEITSNDGFGAGVCEASRAVVSATAAATTATR
jgi:hypothetical protein